MSSRRSERRYAVVGAGRWGTRIARILEESGRKVRLVPISRPSGLDDVASYRRRLTEALERDEDRGDIVWLAIPPRYQDVCVGCAIELGRNVIVEKPWNATETETAALIEAARGRQVQVAVHFEYCMLDRVSEVQREFEQSARPAIFSGAFCVSTPDRHSIPALHYLGCHLLAIHQHAFSQAEVGSIEAAYNATARRNFRVQAQGRDALVDFLSAGEPIVQRFFTAFEQHLEGDLPFSLDLAFALRVRALLNRLETRST